MKTLLCASILHEYIVLCIMQVNIVYVTGHEKPILSRPMSTVLEELKETDEETDSRTSFGKTHISQLYSIQDASFQCICRDTLICDLELYIQRQPYI